MRVLPIILLCVTVVACSDDEPAECRVGSLGCACHSNGTCNAGLDCRSSLCVSHAAGDPIPGDPVAGDPIAGDPIAGDPIAGDPIAGDPIAGDPVAGDPIAGDPLTGTKRIGEPCGSNGECLSNQCPTDFCRGAAGERCRPFGLPSDSDLCLEGGVCWYADAQGKTFRCFPPSCVGQACSYWEGNEVAGDCTGVMQLFSWTRPGSPGAVCGDTGGGVEPHEWACSNGFDDDLDGSADDLDTEDCASNGTPATWLTNTTGRGVRAVCPNYTGTCDTVCSSAVGGPIDVEAHASICWPNTGACAGLTRQQAMCRWWDFVTDDFDACPASVLHERPDGATCGAFGCRCEGGVATEVLCGDGLDNDFDGSHDAADSDCQRAPGEPCFPGAFNGVGVDGFNGGSDQCSDADICWCADASCGTGRCLDNSAACVTGNAFWCHYYPSPAVDSCGTEMNRPDDEPAWPLLPHMGRCVGGNPGPIGTNPRLQPCGGYWECASGLCLCGTSDCGTRRCWDPGDCSGNICNYLSGTGTCSPLTDPPMGTPLACGGGEFLGIDTTSACSCTAGVPHELACDDYYTNDLPADPHGDWFDTDCAFDFAADMRARYRP